MVDDFDRRMVTYADGQSYIEIASNDPALKKLLAAGARPVGLVQIIEGADEPEVTFFAADFAPDLLHAGNGGGSERRKYWFSVKDWEHFAQQRRRFGD
jgi:hypothetical protein